MFTKDDARTAVGILGNVISLVLFLSPVPTFYRIWKKRAVEQYSAVPYLATFMNCALWVLYGLPVVQPHSLLVVTINGAGFSIEIVYLSLFLIFSAPRNRLRLLVLVVVECAAIALLSILVLTIVTTAKRRADIVGSICMAGNIIMYASPLSVMKLVITTKSVEYMPFSISLFSFVNGLCWTAYALIRFDPFILVPNSIGASLGLTQLVIYAAFYPSTQTIIAERQARGEMGLPKIDQNADVNGV